MDGVAWVSCGVIDFFIWVIPDSIDASIIATLNIRQQIITNHQSLGYLTPNQFEKVSA